ncbi:hypothetical protein NPIL_351911 [Nephila pilipes]|uniref:Uncharacterized protein n=1 Tax=Nephila pilipes TaxID=299642 RepID=A0A8X6QSG6_NEPPI|nr:hypothetical protein NPIL_351911 [Nephila pilipes]
MQFLPNNELKSLITSSPTSPSINRSQTNHLRGRGTVKEGESPDSLGLLLEETSVPSPFLPPPPSRRVMEIVGGRGIDELTVIPAVEGGRSFSWGAPTGLETTKGEGAEKKRERKKEPIL